MIDITILKKEVVYYVPSFTDEEEKRAREFKQELYEKFETVDVYPNGRHESRIVCGLGNCLRCIEPYEDEDTGEEMEGEKKPAECEECRVCHDCEHFNDCSKSE